MEVFEVNGLTLWMVFLFGGEFTLGGVAPPWA